jgi:capsular exopolysaccharide synthesis family protein
MISDPVQGMSLYLSGIIPEERFIIEENYFYNGFDVIPAGEIPPNPTELLMSDRFRGLIARLKKDYDYVFLDSTPLDVVTDATIVGKHADLTIFVVREGHTHRRKLRELKKIFEKKQFKEIATILNGSKVKISISKHQTYFKEKTKKVAELPRTTNIPGKQRLKFPEERLLTE